MRGLQLLLRHFLAPEVEGDEEVVGIAVDARAVELAQKVDALERLRAALGDVAERDDQVGPLTLQIVEDGAKRNGVAVHVGDKRDPHSAELMSTP